MRGSQLSIRHLHDQSETSQSAAVVTCVVIFRVFCALRVRYLRIHWLSSDLPPDSIVESNPLPPNEYYIFPESYSETTKERLKELFVTDVCELQEEILLRLRRKEMKDDLSKLRETPVLQDGKQLYVQVALVEEGDDYAFAAIIGPRDFYELKGLSWPSSARNAGISPEPGIYLPRQDS